MFQEGENFPEKNEKNEYGANVTIHAIFERHGEKKNEKGTGETGLTEKGRINSRKFGENLSARSAIKNYDSNTDRTIETGELAKTGSPTENKLKRRPREELAFHGSKGEFYNQLISIRDELMGENPEKLPEIEFERRRKEAANKQMDYYFSFGDQRPDPSTYSSVETAATVASLVKKYINMPSKLKNDSGVDLINSSHDLVLASFLKEVMVREVGAKKIRGFDKIKEIGGVIDYNETFEILVKTDRQGQKTVKLIFRGQEYDLDLDRLEELDEINSKLKKEKM
jgi:hypothetical protein